MSEHVYKHLELSGSSKTSTHDPNPRAIQRASETVPNIKWFCVQDVRGHVEDGKVAHWQVTIKVGFTLEE